MSLEDEALSGLNLLQGRISLGSSLSPPVVRVLGLLRIIIYLRLFRCDMRARPSSLSPHAGSVERDQLPSTSREKEG